MKPGLQSVHSVSLLSLKRPRGHKEHSSAPGAGWKVPPTHPSQAVWPYEDWKLPGEHSAHVEAPNSAEAVPGEHSVHKDCPTSAANRPTSHGKQETWPGEGWALATAHGVQTYVAPCSSLSGSENVPGAHHSHAVAVARLGTNSPTMSTMPQPSLQAVSNGTHGAQRSGDALSQSHATCSILLSVALVCFSMPSSAAELILNLDRNSVKRRSAVSTPRLANLCNDTFEDSVIFEPVAHSNGLCSGKLMGKGSKSMNALSGFHQYMSMSTARGAAVNFAHVPTAKAKGILYMAARCMLTSKNQPSPPSMTGMHVLGSCRHAGDNHQKPCSPPTHFATRRPSRISTPSASPVTRRYVSI
mmetsp:Transcript_120556/g.348395  ORF Transcript_120556/g.348395 Transcript_120556/m.348395 type:complete len:357 (+) Transcript_120556:73-1143(+)